MSHIETREELCARCLSIVQIRFEQRCGYSVIRCCKCGSELDRIYDEDCPCHQPRERKDDDDGE